MIPMFLISTPDLQALVNLLWVQSVEITVYGFDVHLIDPMASLCVTCNPAEAKAIFAAIHNAVARYNGTPAEAAA
jgi:hypothetical protein